MGNGERECRQKIFAHPDLPPRARPSPPPRAARQDLPVLLKPANHTLAFRRGISAESSFVNAKHFQPRSFSDAPTRYKVLSSITRNLSWKFLLTVIVSPPCCVLNLAASLAEILLPRQDVTISTVTPFAFFARSSSVTTSTQLSMRRIDFFADRMNLAAKTCASNTCPS